MLLLAGGVDSQMRVYVQPPSKHFLHTCTLTGHENWIRGIAVVEAGVPAAGKALPHLWIASAGQDRIVRIWTIEELHRPSATSSQVSVCAGASIGAPVLHSPPCTKARASWLALFACECSTGADTAGTKRPYLTFR
jgi:WD40 repeat protein